MSERPGTRIDGDADTGGGVAADAGTDPESGTAYGGVVGAFPYAFRRSSSLALKLYVPVSLLLSLVVVLIFVLALVTLVSGTTGPGGTFTFSRAFFVLLMTGVVGPLIAPVLLVARRHRQTGSSRQYDTAVAAAGYAFVISVYAGLVISTPPEQQTSTAGVAGAVLTGLYGLPRLAGFVPPVLAVGLLWLVHRRLGDPESGDARDGA